MTFSIQQVFKLTHLARKFMQRRWFDGTSSSLLLTDDYQQPFITIYMCFCIFCGLNACAALHKNEIFYLFAVSFAIFLYFIIFALFEWSFFCWTPVWMRISTRKCYRTMTVPRVSLSQNQKPVLSSHSLTRRYFHSFNSLRLLMSRLDFL